MRAAKSVTVIPAIAGRLTSVSASPSTMKRVAAYARVSTDNEEQLTSYEAQVDYYTRHIKSNPAWQMVEVYSDEGISATSTKKREGFNRMIADALDGKIDLIITKSVSRFARNTVDTLTTVRQLKEKGVEVFFEKENIYTLDSKGELLITIMSSLAQEESRSISENVTWGQRKRFADGKVSLPYSRFLGYDRSEDGLPQINEEEAKIVRLIYRLFLEGQTPHSIAKHLTEQGLTSPGGKEKWQSGTIRNILTNEKYKGDALLQKKYTVDFLTKKQKINEGEVPQYYVENSHPAIISSDVFDMVQEEMKQRKTMKNRHSSAGMFSSKIICGECGGLYGSKVWHSTSKYRRVIFQCNNKFKGADKCKTPHITEDDIKKLFVTAVNKLISNKDEILENFEVIKNTIFDVIALETEHSEMKDEMSIVAGLIQKCVNENAQAKLDQEVYKQRYEGLVSRFEAAKERFNEISEHQQRIKVRRDRVEAFLCSLKEQDELVAEFDERLWHTLVDTVTVFSEEDIRFTFKDGSEF